jgi:uncharacterized protein with ParB-like and HNH nuclease domain
VIKIPKIQGNNLTDLAELTIGELLKRHAPFLVPPYQRAYSWESEELTDFINDINNLILTYKPSMAKGTPPKRHFFGSIVCANLFGKENERQFILIDGQQRLATILLSLNIIANSLNEISTDENVENKIQKRAKKMAKNIQLKYVYIQDLNDDDEEDDDDSESDEMIRITDYPLRLTMSKADNSIFEKIIRNEKIESKEIIRESHKRLLDSQNIIKTNLIDPVLIKKQDNIEEQIQGLLNIRNCIISDLFIIQIVCSDKLNANRVFSTLNNRGRTLSDGDLLRSDTLQALEKHPKKQEEVEKYWDRILKYKSNNIDDFLRAYYTSQIGERPPNYGLSEKFYEKIFNSIYSISAKDTEKAKVLSEKIKDLCDESKVFQDLLSKGEWPYLESKLPLWQRDRLKRLIITLDHTLCMPLLLSARKKFNEKKFFELVDLLERFFYRYKIVCNARVQKLAEKYYESAHNIRTDNEYQIDILKKELQKLLDLSANDDRFEFNLLQLEYKPKSGKKNKQILHLLTTLEDYFSWHYPGIQGKQAVDSESIWDLSLIDIEHIYPQNPKKKDKIEGFKPVTHKLGNLSFLAQGENRNLNLIGNKSFKEKKENYAKSKIRLTKELAKLESWGCDQFKERNKILIEMTLKIYNLS